MRYIYYVIKIWSKKKNSIYKKFSELIKLETNPGDFGVIKLKFECPLSTIGKE